MINVSSVLARSIRSGLTLAAALALIISPMAPAFSVAHAAGAAPVADDQSVTTAQDTALAVTLSASDTDGDTLTYSVVSGPTNGALSGTEPNLTYTPNAGYFGSDSFTFTANDGTTDSNVATISIDVTATPVASHDIYVDASGTDASGHGGSADPYKTLAYAVSQAVDGDIIHVSGVQNITSTITLDKAITIDGEGVGEIDTTGSNNVFLTHTASGTITIQGLKFVKSDNADQNIIAIQGNDVSIENNDFTGQYVLNGGGTTRAMVISPGVSGLDIGGNRIQHLRQPAYFDASTGSVHDNYVSDTKGWVVASASNLDFTGNSWGTNIGDIAIICGSALANPDTDTCPDANNYTDISALSQANNNAVVEQQTPVRASALLSVAYVDDSAAAGGNGTKANPYQTIAQAVARVVEGGTVYVADGSYAAGLTLDKGITISGANAGTGATDTRSAESNITTGSPAFTVTTDDAVTIDGFTFNGTGAPVSSPNGNPSVITFNNNIVENTTGYMYFANIASLDFEGNFLTHLEDTVADPNSEGLFLAGNWNGSTGTVATFTNNTWQDLGNTGMNLSNVSGSITDNTFENVPYYGILLANNSSDMTISGNTFDHITNPDPSVSTYGAGVRFYTPSFTGTVDVTDNTFSNSAIGVGVRAPADITGMDIHVNGNRFEGNTVGVKNDATGGTLDATGNWWNDASGPTIASNPGGVGDPIIENPGLVDYGSFCVNDTCTTPGTTHHHASGHSGGSASSVTTTTTTGTGEGEVLGAATYNFTVDLHVGSTGADVSALQQMLIDAGYLHIAAPTGYYGPLTTAAVAAWQKANGISPAAGYFGPISRAKLLAVGVAGVPGLSDAQKAALLATLADILKQALAIQQELDDMK